MTSERRAGWNLLVHPHLPPRSLLESCPRAAGLDSSGESPGFLRVSLAPWANQLDLTLERFACVGQYVVEVLVVQVLRATGPNIDSCPY